MKYDPSMTPRFLWDNFATVTFPSSGRHKLPPDFFSRLVIDPVPLVIQPSRRDRD